MTQGRSLRHLLGPDGLVALRALMSNAPLIAFDFDGTLAPIVAHPRAARVPTAVGRRLQRLALRWPVAIITGRAVADVRPRLGFEPLCIIGCHGAEAPDDDRPADYQASLDAVRRRLDQVGRELSAAGVIVEDKAATIALHFRLAPDRAAAERLIGEVLAEAGPGLHVFGGKLVVNVVSASAPNKAQALHGLARRQGAQAVFFAGDDVNDEPVFEAAEPLWLTVKVGRGASQARFYIDNPAEMPLVLDRMLDPL